MHHADAAAFPKNVGKADAFRRAIDQTKSLTEGQRNWVCNLANVASLLWHAYKSLPEPSRSVNWAGFYVLDPLKKDQLILGPFQGKVACQTIAFSRGVCGKAASTGKTQMVDDVEKEVQHIACDGATRSEIVVPIIKEGKVVGVIDIDSMVESTFDATDAEALEELAAYLADCSDWGL